MLLIVVNVTRWRFRMKDSKLNHKQALIEEIVRMKPTLFTVVHLECMDVNGLKATLDKICEGRI